MRTKVRTRLLKFTMAMEIVMAITILGAILASIALLICGSVEKFCCQWETKVKNKLQKVIKNI